MYVYRSHILGGEGWQIIVLGGLGVWKRGKW